MLDAFDDNLRLFLFVTRFRLETEGVRLVKEERRCTHDEPWRTIEGSSRIQLHFFFADHVRNGALHLRGHPGKQGATPNDAGGTHAIYGA